MLLTEIRDSAVHFVNHDRDLAFRVHEIGTASLLNYVAALGDWFDHDLGSHRFAILPLSFEAASAKAVKAPRRSEQAANLLAHMERACADIPGSADGRYAVSLRVETRIVGGRTTDAVPVKLGKGPDAVKVELTDEAFKDRWPHEHKQMVTLVKQRVAGLIINNAFHAAVKALSAEERFARVRRLDLNNPDTKSKKTYYSGAMIDALAAVLAGK